MSNVVLGFQLPTCPNCRLEIKYQVTQASVLADIGTDGKHIGIFWPLLSQAIFNQPGSQISDTLFERIQSLRTHGVAFEEYDANASLSTLSFVTPSPPFWTT
jgi:hypothetical protein